MSGIISPEFLVPVMNFYMAMCASGDRKTFKFVSGNLLGPSLCQIQRRYFSIAPTPFINLSNDDRVSKVSGMLKKVKMGLEEKK
eukprot:12029973-Ditylum_brightwellii.AAC.1